MGNSDFIEILFWAAIAVFLVLRLHATLGSRTGHERKAEWPPSSPTESPDPKVISLDSKRSPEHDTPSENNTTPKTPTVAAVHQGKTTQHPLDPDSPLAQGLRAITERDDSFDSAAFLNGAATAFDMILTAFADGDRETLKNLLSEAVFDNFNQAITAREAAGNHLETTLVALSDAELVSARHQDHSAVLDVSFVSEQITVTRNSAGEIIAGDPNSVRQIRDLWTFARDLRSQNPNWELVETRTAH